MAAEILPIQPPLVTCKIYFVLSAYQMITDITCVAGMKDDLTRRETEVDHTMRATPESPILVMAVSLGEAGQVAVAT